MKYDSSWHQIENIPHVQLKYYLVNVKFQNAPNTMDHSFTSTFGWNSELV
jgi:hypothetical protein